LGRDFGPLCNGLYSHPRIAFTQQEPPGGFDDAAARIASLALADQ
jgi:hypothetical protein